MRSRLEQLSRRLIEVDALLADPDAANDMDRFRKLSRERAELDPVVAAFSTYTQAEDDLSTAQEMLGDPEMKGLAEEEIRASKGKLETLGADLQRLLLPRDAAGEEAEDEGAEPGVGLKNRWSGWFSSSSGRFISGDEG